MRKNRYVSRKRVLFSDQRGSFEQVFRSEDLIRDHGFHPVQVNVSHSRKGVLRGLHMQMPPYSQRKLIFVLRGSVLDFFVETSSKESDHGVLRKVLITSDSDGILLEGSLAHGFLALEEETIVLYAVDSIYSPSHEVSYSALPYVNEILSGVAMSANDLIISDKDIGAPNLF